MAKPVMYPELPKVSERRRAEIRRYLERMCDPDSEPSRRNCNLDWMSNPTPGATEEMAPDSDLSA